VVGPPNAVRPSSRAISAGEWVTATGNWVNDRTHGQQFKAIRGTGPVYAKKLLRAFGDKLFDVIEAQPDPLQEGDGIGPVRRGNCRRLCGACMAMCWSKTRPCCKCAPNSVPRGEHGIAHQASCARSRKYRRPLSVSFLVPLETLIGPSYTACALFVCL